MHPDVVKLNLLGIKTFRYNINGKWYAYRGGTWPRSVHGRSEPMSKFIHHANNDIIHASTEEELARMVLSKIALHGSVT